MNQEKKREPLEQSEETHSTMEETPEADQEVSPKNTKIPEQEPLAKESKNTEPQDTDTLSEEEKMMEQIETLEQELVEAKDNYLRLTAEYDNYRKRTTKEKTTIYPQATADTVECFLPIIDNFERALEYDVSTEEFKEGIELINHSLQDIMEKLKVEPIGERGEPFDPTVHNAIMHTEDDELPESCVSQVLQKGYKIGDRVIRHAMVETAN